ncbi:MAG TPA: MFS transporter [Candidatus Eisenbergiella pullistercoris]|uniref:MFS transporter n=1 Tax=Candidatus Eisenbergiella pullistercoris TaxID=2838555 RepID=A0A9D1YPD6_9FIRM|nr:MFS transporter [Candidatus Eisenbergiella pullistercoris]
MRADRKRWMTFWMLFGFNALYYIPGATFSAYISVYYQSKGMSVSQIGLLSAMGPLLALVMQPAWGMLSDRTGKHMAVLRIALLGAAGGVLCYYRADTFWLFAACILIYGLFNCAIGPIGDAVVLDMARENDLEFSRIRMGGTLAYALVVVFAGVFLRDHPTASFGITAAAWGTMFLLTWFMRGDVKKYKTEKKAGVLSCFQNRKILFVLAYACIFQIVLGCYGSFIGVVVTDMGYDNAMIGRLMCVSALSELPVLLCIRFLMRKVKIEYLLLTAGAAMTVRIWLPLTGSIAFIFLGQALQGMTYMIMYYGCVMFMDQNFPREHRGTGQSLFYMVQSGIASTFSNIAGGWLGERIGLTRTYFWYGLILLAVTAACGVVMYSHSRQGAKERRT